MTNSFKTLAWVIFEFVLIFILLSMPSSGEPGKGWVSFILELPLQFLYFFILNSIQISPLGQQEQKHLV